MKLDQNFGSIVKGEAKVSLIFTLATFLPLIASFFLMPLFWRKLTPSDYGVIAIIDMIRVFSGFFLGMGLDLSITRLYYEWDSQERKRNLGTLWIVDFAIIAVFGSLFIALALHFNHFIFPNIENKLVVLGLIAIILGSLSVVPFAVIRIKRLPLLYSSLILSQTFLELGLKIYFVLILEHGVEGFLKANIYTTGALAVCLLICMFFFATPAFNYVVLKKALRYSLPLFPSRVLGIITSTIDKFLLQKFVSVEALGLYSQGLKFSSIIAGLHNALKMSYTPFLFQYIEKEGGKEIIRIIVKFYITTLFLAALGVSLFIDEFVLWVNQSSFFEVIDYVPFLIIAVLISSMNLYYAPGIGLAKKNELRIIPSFINLVIVVFGSYVLIPRFQVAGVILVQILGVSTVFWINVILSRKVYELKLDFFPLIYMSLAFASILLLEWFQNFPYLWQNFLFSLFLFLSFLLLLLFNNIREFKIFLRTKNKILKGTN
jgi:O-antigen/teichoic acid export membrane protein